MVTRIIYTEISPQLESWFGRSWPKILAVGLMLILAAIFVLVFPRLVATLIALGLFLSAGVVITTAVHIWQLSRASQGTSIDVD